MLMVMGPLQKGTHVGKWGKISMQSSTSLEVKAVDSQNQPTEESHNPTMYVNVDGEAVLTTPVSMTYHDNQITVRGATSIPNE